MERVMDRNTKKTVTVPVIHGVGVGPIGSFIFTRTPSGKGQWLRE
jgi:hypothetical protein